MEDVQRLRSYESKNEVVVKMRTDGKTHKKIICKLKSQYLSLEKAKKAKKK